ncbi:type III-B CRISPR module-associated protein Cmr5 [Clostridium amazonitimonense]|uniref:type III-B CRISPR module-associated protein Cmr5 n=1 Tax=Clostridium amazonitimonense TaxID=1499689 RepID=UPI000509838D|nr:type III-B CRISPR module-associated protein Cmr5 [Clostridium amazonitimonense]
MDDFKNINLIVANFAMECVESAMTNASIHSGKYKTLVKKMSTLIQQNGLIGTLVFNLSKISKTYHKEVLKNIIMWNVKNSKINNMNNFDTKQMIFTKTDNEKNDIKVFTDYIEWVTSLEPVEYRLLTKEMINLFAWIKRFADGMIEGE